jgi:glycosyltransferase involved in cell wall biosynthesis
VVVPSRFETFSLVSLEAAAYGKPVVAFDIAGLRWLPDSVCLKARPFDVLSLTQSINLILTDLRLRRSMSRSAQKFAQQFTWEKTAASYHRFIQEILNTYASIS